METMKRQVTLGEVLAMGILILGTILSFWISVNVRLSALEINKQAQADNWTDAKASFEKINNKLDKQQDGINDIKISVERKQDRQ